MSEHDVAEPSTGNVFEDLGFPNATEHLAKADIAIRISRMIDARGLTQKQAAGTLGIRQSQVADMLRGRLSGFSMDSLSRFLHALNQDEPTIVSGCATGKDRKTVTAMDVLATEVKNPVAA
ncbi:MAG: helix-turn-helix domain-containing protein [Magnetococcus sp. DMHC-1]|nr:XRE family transcriptional regulator [Magnetococcales bacterium]MBF0155530.1 XRE family transcriptional regulator [Magnetococcales bacterium]